MLCIDDIINDYDKMERMIRKSGHDINTLFDQFDGYNWEYDIDYIRFDFEDGDYVFTIIQYTDERPQLANEFSIFVGTDLIDFERS